ncbi:MAG: DUF4397 domain-containing protein [Gammaproteobacteria bacterium]|nr:DUF4397 domain-containing protein [Gammaproteobacteria bacterium]
MNRISRLFAAAAVLMLAACDTGSTLPEATGKGSIRAINAMPTSPEFRFLIEERALDNVSYKSASSSVRFDDLEYTFSIEIPFAGESSVRRVARQFIDVQANRDYTLLVSGAVAAPTITLWEGDERIFEEGSTEFAARFAHTAASIDAVDYYFSAPGVAPVLGEQVATLSFGEIAAPVDYSAGDYVLTITSAGDPDAVLYVSGTTSFNAGNTLFIMPFDGIARDTAPVVVRAIAAAGGSESIPDSRFPPSVQFVNASIDLGTSDIYDDQELTSRIVAGHAYRDVSEEISIAAETNVFLYTPAGDTGAVTLETSLPASGGLRYRVVAVGVAGSLQTFSLVPSSAGVDTHVKLTSLHTSNNFEFLDIYAVAPGESVDDANPASSLARLSQTNAALPAGSYDLYITEFVQKAVLAGPYRLDVSVGDVVDIIILDTVDPAVLDVLFVAGGPST